MENFRDETELEKLSRYTKRAEELRAMAAEAGNPSNREALEALVTQYEKLCEQLRGVIAQSSKD